MIRQFAKLLSKILPNIYFKGSGIFLICISSFLIMNLMLFKLERKYVLLCLLGFILVYVLVMLFIYISFKIKSKQMTSALTQHHNEVSSDARQVKIAVKDIQHKWKEALSTLKKAKINIYELPWTLLIGEPQSGKTTSLLESDLDFPLKNQSVSGACGTVNCEWLFTNDAVFIDTAGRFTMPIDNAPDKKEWHSFLKLLSRYRPRCPINSVVVTIPSTSLLEDTLETIEKKAKQVRGKLVELTDILGVEFPIYIMISKMDLVVGFSELSTDLSDKERTQIFGWDCKHQQPEFFNPQDFIKCFTDLSDRLYLWILRRLYTIQAKANVNHLLEFPSEFSNIKQSLSSYLEIIFRKDRFNPPLLWRGCYFCSSLQEGKAIYSAIVNGAENESLMKNCLTSFFSNKPCFVQQFYQKVIKERGLVQFSHKVKKRDTKIRLAAAVSSVTLIIIVSLFLWSGYKTIPLSIHSLEKHVIMAETIITNKTVKSTKNNHEIFHLKNAITKNREKIDRYGVGLWLPYIKNDFLDNLGVVEKQLQQIILKRLIHKTEKYLEKASLDTYDDHTLYINTLNNYSLVLNDCSFEKTDHDSFKQMLSQTLLTESSQFEFDELWQSSTQSYPCPLIEKKAQGLLIFRKAIMTLMSFWKKYPHDNHDKWLKGIYLTADAYTKILFQQHHDDPKRLIKNIQNFNLQYDRLKTINLNSSLSFLSNVSKKCNNDFERLQSTVSNVSKSEMSQVMYSLVYNYGSVCRELASNIESNIDETIKNYTYIIQDNGVIQPHLSSIRTIMNDVLTFTQFMITKENEMHSSSIQITPEKYKELGAEWTQKKENLKNKVDTLTPQIPQEFQPERLNRIISAHIESLSWKTQEAVLYRTMNHLFGNGNIKNPPLYARVKWLSAQINTANDIKVWLEKECRDSKKRKQLSLIISGKMYNAYKQSLGYWAKKLKEVDPAKEVLKTKTWKQARDTIVDRKGEFVNSEWLNLFVEHMPMTVIDQIHENYFNEHNKSIEQRLKYVALIATDYLDILYAAQNDYYNAIKTLSDEDPCNWENVKKLNPDDFKALSKLKSNIALRADIKEDNLLINRLDAIEIHCVKLFKNYSQKHLHIEWRQFLAKWFRHFGYNFPFGKTKGSVKYDSDQNTITLKFDTISLKDLEHFFFSSENNPQEIKKRIKIISSLTNTDYEQLLADKYQDLFLTRCIAWKKFLFPDDTTTAFPYNVKINVDTIGTNGADRFTVIKIQGLEKNKESELRVSGSTYHNFQWNFNHISNVLIRGINEESGRKSGLNITGGDLSLLQYVFSYGMREKSNNTKENWEVMIVFPDIIPGYSKAISIKMNMTWNNHLPELIKWPDYILWGKL